MEGEGRMDKKEEGRMDKEEEGKIDKEGEGRIDKEEGRMDMDWKETGEREEWIYNVQGRVKNREGRDIAK